VTILLQRYNKRIALYASASSNRGGTGVYTKRLIQGFQAAGLHEVVPLGLESSGLAGKLISEHILMSRKVKNGRFDFAHLPAFAGNTAGGVPYAVTVHDMAFMAGPGWFPFFKSLYFRLHFPRIAAGASVIIADSDFTVSEIERLLGLSSVRVYLSAPANCVSDSMFRKTCCVDGDYILSTSTIEPRKNVGALLAAWQSIRHVHPELTLVIAGRWGWGKKETKTALLNASGVRWLGSITGNLLSSALAGAELLVYPSLYEGFGLPPLEAAASGTPFVTGPAEALHEIYGSVAAAVSGETPSSIAEAVLNALECSANPDELRSFAGGFTSRAMAENTYMAYGKAFE
jgi:glycosyltransferase involved in cell wall biosynthesis